MSEKSWEEGCYLALIDNDENQSPISVKNIAIDFVVEAN